MSVYQVVPDHGVQLDRIFLSVARAVVFERACPHSLLITFFLLLFLVFSFLLWRRHPRHLSFNADVLLLFLLLDSFSAGRSASD